MRKLVLLALGMLVASNVMAADTSVNAKEGIRSFQQDKSAWRREDDENKKFLTGISDSIGAAATINIEQAYQFLDECLSD